MAFGTNYATKTPYGTIAIWYGAVAAVPNGWHLCDGAGGTPDLRDRFIVGAGNSYGKGVTGGEAGHTLSVDEMPGHTHTMTPHSHSYESMVAPSETDNRNEVVGASGYYVDMYKQSRTSGAAGSGATGSKGSGGAHENRPPYYALAYIMKV